MDEPLVIEGIVKEEEGGSGLFLETMPPEGDVTHGYLAGMLLEDFVGKRVRVTVEVIK